MPLKIVRNDITKMHTEAIVNTANPEAAIGSGCDSAVYEAAGREALYAYRKEKIGRVAEGEVFLTPGFSLPASVIIHAVSPLYRGGGAGEEEKLRGCYQKSLQLAASRGIRSIAFPLISTGSLGYPKEEGLRIAVDEISAFLLHHDMQVYLVVFDDASSSLGKNLVNDLEEYIDRNYVQQKQIEEYHTPFFGAAMAPAASSQRRSGRRLFPGANLLSSAAKGSSADAAETFVDFETEHESRLAERMEHVSDTFSQYLLYLIREKKMENAEVYKRAIVDKKIFSKLKNNVDYHPQKLTALCLCVGAKLNLDETKDLLARAGYALSPCDKTDIIFSYFIENQIYDMIELDIQLEEHGLPCIIA